MSKTCFFCQPSNEYVCSGEHCGACGIDAALDAMDLDKKPSGRMYDDRPFLPPSSEEESEQ